MLPFILSQLLILFQQKPSPPIVPLLEPVNQTESTSVVAAESYIIAAWHDKSTVGAVLGIATIAFAMFFHHAEMKQRMLGAKIRIACCSLIYRKVYI